jgi:hypothetical protein
VEFYRTSLLVSRSDLKFPLADRAEISLRILVVWTSGGKSVWTSSKRRLKC